MKNRQFIYLKMTLLSSLIFMSTVSCERELSDEVEFATYATTPEIFIDGFEGGLDYFPFGGSFAEAFSVDEDVSYLGSASMRFDIPQFGVGYGGATFPSTGPRDLSGYDALTFWAKASQGADINEIGFGINGETNNKFQVTMQNLSLSTNWTKYVIPIPDASKLFQEKGMFWYAEGAETPDDEGGYSFWIDELKFEKLGTIAQPQPAILNGVAISQDAFVDIPIELTGLTQTFNSASGQNLTVIAKPSYFKFTSSDIEVARVSELGVVSVLKTGAATITATIGDVAAAGSLALNVIGAFDFAPIPPERNPEDVISIFSDTYPNINIDFFNGFFGGQSTQGGAIDVADNSVIQYTDLNFVTIQFSNPTVDASQMTHIHIDIKVQESVESGESVTVELGDFGADGIFGGVGSDDSAGSSSPLSSSELASDQWVGIDIPLTNFTGGTGGGFSGLNSTSNLAQVTFVSSTISNILVDNIYLYKE